MKPRRHALLLLVLLADAAGCARHPPRAAVGLLEDGVAVFVAHHPLAAGQALRVDEVARTPGASYHVVQARGAEAPHRHVAHDLTVHVLAGEGVLAVGSRRVRLRAGDVALIARGVTHWFTPAGGRPAVALAVFSPPLDAPDLVPVDVDSSGDGG
ncbi:MAG TPA: cupin domain-containing protein [Candidatus Binatia bacterium]|nr:cupin domain-containing protein [Candidatus Binatia bacterium]